MTIYRIEHERNNCIGCGACAATCPDFWKMDEEEAKANLKDAKKEKDGHTTLEIEESKMKCNMQVAQGCPVNVIHIIDLDSDEKKI